MTAKNLVLIALSSLMLVACNRASVYSDYRSVPIDGWAMDSVLQFAVPACDAASHYDIILHIRHTDNYPYQNMWLFVSENEQVDTLEFYLANDRGQWLGNGQAIKEMPVLYREDVTVADSTTISIQQAMREMALKGICEVGVEVKKHGKR